MREARLPAHLEVSALIRAVDASGGFATVIRKGEREVGSILLITCEKGADSVLYERMPDFDKGRKWTLVRRQDSENPSNFNDYVDKRGRQDRDCWIVEIDIANAAQFIPGID